MLIIVITLLLMCLFIPIIFQTTFSPIVKTYSPYLPIQDNNIIQMRNANNIFILRTHCWNEYIHKGIWKQWMRDLPNDRIFILFDLNDKTDIKQTSVPEELYKYIIPINRKMCMDLNSLDRGAWFTVETPLVLVNKYLKKQKIRFDYLWLIEYDVRCTGNWSDLLQSSIHHCYCADFVAAAVQSFWQSPFWLGWGQLTNCSINEHIPYWWNMYKSFLPISRYSSRLLNVYEKSIGEWTQFCEIYLPSRCMQENGFTVGNLHHKCLNQEFFTGTNIITNEKWSGNNCFPENQFYHPIK